jgi:hypothetical protein
MKCTIQAQCYPQTANVTFSIWPHSFEKHYGVSSREVKRRWVTGKNSERAEYDKLFGVQTSSAIEENGFVYALQHNVPFQPIVAHLLGNQRVAPLGVN